MVYLVWHVWDDDIEWRYQKELKGVYKHEDRAKEVCDNYNSPYDKYDYYYVEAMPINYSLKEGSD